MSWRVYSCGSRDSLVSTTRVRGGRLNNRASIPCRDSYVSVSTAPGWTMGPSQPPNEMRPSVLSPRRKAARVWTWPLPSSSEDKNSWGYISTSPYAFLVWYLLNIGLTLRFTYLYDGKTLRSIYTSYYVYVVCLICSHLALWTHLKQQNVTERSRVSRVGVIWLASTRQELCDQVGSRRRIGRAVFVCAICSFEASHSIFIVVTSIVAMWQYLVSCWNTWHLQWVPVISSVIIYKKSC
jgi:hypothetical protein